jgi:hypothetical protein
MSLSTDKLFLCNRQFSLADLNLIRQMIAANPDFSPRGPAIAHRLATPA